MAGGESRVKAAEFQTETLPPRMITLTRISEPEATSYLFTIDPDGEVSLRLTRPEAVARLMRLGVEGAERLVDQAVFYGLIVIHEHG